MLNSLSIGCLAACLLCIPPAHAEVKPFHQDSMTEILAEREGKAFLLVLWSSDCPPCLKELGLLQQFRRRISTDNLVLISTDNPENRSEVVTLLASFELDGFDNWIFGDHFPERLRYRIDPAWFGELPRSYRYSADHRRIGHSGMLSKKFLEKWLRDQPGTPGPL
ncbi:MAG: TlpA family protein disulfide reductase [Gammaproteobacteria bacterium]|nr:TlpA family protein disulfide reductase [Gammaproteobacteria bacterium]